MRSTGESVVPLQAKGKHDQTGVFHKDTMIANKMVVFLSETKWQPPTDIFETRERIVVRIEVPGMAPEQFEVVYADGLLRIRGRRDEPGAEPSRHFRQMEINYGPFEKRISFDSPVSAGSIRAVYQNGFLELTVPRSKRSRSSTTRPRIKVTIQVAGP